MFIKTPLFVLAFGGIVASSSSASVLTYTADLRSSPYFPSGNSPGIGTATIEYDSQLHTLHLSLSFSDLLGPTTLAYLHAATTQPYIGTAPFALAALPGFPTQVLSGNYDHTINLQTQASFYPNFFNVHGQNVAQAESFLAASMQQGRSYLMIRTTAFPNGEIRGYLIPSPGGLAFLGLGLVASRRTRSRS